MEKKVDRIGFANFKSFGPNMQTFSNKPITLVYGANSIGKSSVLHALLYFKQCMLTGRYDLKRGFSFGDELDLGGFESIIHKKNIDSSISYQFEISDHKELERLFREDDAIDLDTALFNLTISKESDLIFDFECIVDNKQLFKVSLPGNTTEIDKVMESTIEYLKKKPDDMDTLIYSKISTIIFPLMYFAFEKNYKYIGPLRYYPTRKDMKFSKGLKTPKKIKEREKKSIWKSKVFLSLSGQVVVQVLLRVKYFKLFTLLKKKRGAILASLAMVIIFPLLLLMKLLFFLSKYMLKYTFFRDTYLPYGENSIGNKILRNGAKESKNMWKDFYLQEDTRKKLNDWLSNPKKLKSNYSLEVKDNELYFIDKKNGTTVYPREIGLGISQVLPILHTCFGSKDSKVFIEQPELHLHPAAQSELADEFIKSMHNNENEFMIETHSEHLLLRIMRRMRETAEGIIEDDSLKLTPDDVALLYVDTDGENTYILELELDDDGTLLDPWPGGFFEEGFNERFM